MIIKELLTEASGPWRVTSSLKDRRLREFITPENVSKNVELLIQVLGAKLSNEDILLLGKLMKGEEVLEPEEVEEVIQMLMKSAPRDAQVRRTGDMGYMVEYPSNYVLSADNAEVTYYVQYNKGKWVFSAWPASSYATRPTAKKFDDEQDLLTHIKKFHKMAEKYKT